MQDSVFINRGFQLLNTFHFNHQIKCISQQGYEGVVVFYYVGSDNVVSWCPYRQNEQQHKFLLGDGIRGLIYSKKHRLFVASCPDLALRVFNERFELLDTVHITATVLSLAFNEVTSELYTGGVGCINAWKLRHRLHKPLVPSSPLRCSIRGDQWVMCLELDGSSGNLVVLCRDTVYIMDAISHEQLHRFTNLRRGSFTCGVLFDTMEYLITGAKDGLIKIWNYIRHYEVHTFIGHMKAVTGLKAHPSAPCVISCSLDGTIRIWHLESLTECYRVDCGDGLLGMCNEFPSGNKLATFSQQEVRMWEVNQLEAHFTTVNSCVTGMFRVSCPQKSAAPSRIVAMAEDDGVRLLSPVSGRVLTILFPMFSAQMLENVAYLLCEERLFVLLQTGSILMVSTTTNPCSTLQLWTPSTRNTIYCIATVNVVLEDGTRLPVVFAGQHSGDIVLVYVSHSRLTMPFSCPSHDGPVRKLIGSCDLVDTSPDSHQSALVSYGQNDILNVWSMDVDKAASITLKILLSLNLSPGPTLMCLLDSTLCLAVDSSLFMLDLTEQEHSTTTPAVQSLNDVPLFIHQKEDEHSAAIISLVCSTELKLYATSSRDGLVKIWSATNQLVSEIKFDESLAALCFANSRGDLLVGFQKHICVVQAEKYLTRNYMDSVKGLLFNEKEERPITFDPELEFWYDSDRVPSLPAEQEMRDQLFATLGQRVRRMPLDMSQIDTFSHSHIHKTLSSLREESGLLDEEERQASAVQLQRLVNQSLVKTISQRYSKILETEGNQSRISIGPYPSHLHSEIDSTHSLATHTLSGSSDMSSLFNPSLCPLSTQEPPPLVQVLPLNSPSDKYPIAADGYIPNSVIRGRISYVPAVVSFPVYRPPTIRQRFNYYAFARHSLPHTRLHTSAYSHTSAHSYPSTPSLSPHASVLFRLSEEAPRDESVEVSAPRRCSQDPRKSLITCVSSFKLDPDILNWSFGDIPTLEETPNKSLTESSAGSVGERDDRLSAMDRSFASAVSSGDRRHSTPVKSPSRSGFSRQRTPSAPTDQLLQEQVQGVPITSAPPTTNNGRFSSINPSVAAKLLFGPPPDSTKRGGREDVPRLSTPSSANSSWRASATPSLPSQVMTPPLSSDSARSHQDEDSPHEAIQGVFISNTPGPASNGSTTPSLASVVPSPRDGGGHPLSGNYGSTLPSLASVVLSPSSSSESTKSCQGESRDWGLELSRGETPAMPVVYEISELEMLIRRICGMIWFPKRALRGNKVLSLEQVFSVLIGLLKNALFPVFRKVCGALLDLNKLAALSDNQQITFALQLVDRLSGLENTVFTHSLRLEILQTLKKLGVFSEEVLFAILPLLIDSNEETRKTAFAVLHSITGIVRKSQLHQLFLELGLLQEVVVDEDEVIGELAWRVRNGLVKPPSGTWFLSQTHSRPRKHHTTTHRPPSHPTTAHRPPSHSTTAHHPPSYRSTGHHPPSHPTTAHHPPSHPTTAHHPPSHPTTAHRLPSYATTTHHPPSHPTTAHHPPSHPTTAHRLPSYATTAHPPPSHPTAVTFHGHSHPHHDTGLPGFSRRLTVGSTRNHTHNRQEKRQRVKLQMKHHLPVNQARKNKLTNRLSIQDDSRDKSGTDREGWTGSFRSKGIRDLILLNPNTLSQCPLAMSFMGRSKVNFEKDTVHENNFKWSEVHPVIKESMIRSSPKQHLYEKLASFQNGNEQEHQHVTKYACRTNLTNRRLLWQLKPSLSQKSTCSNRSREEGRELEQGTVISLPKLNLSATCL